MRRPSIATWDASDVGDPRVVALGGGHGLHASLSALRRVTHELTAVVTVADNGGSSGRLRGEFAVLPPGDLRMALAALCGDDEWGNTWARVLQHRLQGDGELHDHVVGNLLIVGLWELLGDPVAGLDWIGRLLNAHGRVLPMSTTPMDIRAAVKGADAHLPDNITTVTGQVEVATTAGHIVGIELIPEDACACPETLAAIEQADWIVLGPGSWFSSVVPHLLLSDLRKALTHTSARIVVVLNLEPQHGETHGYLPEDYLATFADYAPDLSIDTVLVDAASVDDLEPLRAAVNALPARLVVADVAAADDGGRHDPQRLAAAYSEIMGI